LVAPAVDCCPEPVSLSTRRLIASCSLAALIIVPLLVGPVLAQSFDPATVDWERLSRIPMRDTFISRFNEACGSCHGEDLRGLTRGPALVGAPLRQGDSVAEIAASIANGSPEAGMPSFAQTLSPAEIHNLALYVAEQRQGTTILDKRDAIELALPRGTVRSERHAFRVEVVATGLDPMPFSIAPLPDGRILLTERMRGLRIIERDGTLSPYIRGTPPVYDDSTLFLGQVQGLGWLLEVAPHPEYERNGWIYLHHTDRCSNCNALSRRANGRPVSMNRLVRGRIRDGEWVDEEVLWEADKESYSMMSDLSAGGRIAFDQQGHVYFSVGMKGTMDFTGIQDLDLPYGKVHRLHDDGRIPADNPFLGQAGALGSTWTLGHRSTQGLELNPWTGELWATEMGPRGGDELNRLVRGGNYGWPVFTSGVNYDGRPVDVARQLALTLQAEDAIFPVVDWTPAVAISSFIFYDATPFPGWRGSIIAGTLRATDLLRLELEGDRVVHTEVLLEDVARFRDIEPGADGTLYLLLENKSGSQLVRLVPAD
jgi:glucose/arabinose dehydrogenase